MDASTGMFGPAPWEIQQAQQQALQDQAAHYAGQTPLQRAAQGMFTAGGQLGNIIAPALGGVNPQVQMAQQTQDAAKGVDVSTPDGLMQAAVRMKDINPNLAAGLVAKAQAMKAQESTMALATAKAGLDASQAKRAEAAANLSDARAAALDRDANFKNLPPQVQAIMLKNSLPEGSPSIQEITDWLDKQGKSEKNPTSVLEFKFAQTPEGGSFTGTYNEWLKSKAQAIHVTTAAAAPTGPLDPQTVDYYATQSLAGDNSWQVGLARGKVGQQLIAAVKDRIPQMAKEQGITPVQAIADKQTLAAKGAAIKDFTSGQSAKAVRSFGVAIDHLDTLGQLGEALGNGNVRAVNMLGNTASTWTGGAAPTNFIAAKQTVAAEVEKAIIGGATALGDRETAAKNISDISSPEQLVGYVNTVKKLMAGQLQGYEQQYKVGTGRTDFHTRLQPKASAMLRSVQGGTQMNAQDQQALQWANANPTDPRAAQIKQKLGQ
jgi:hypothetical protein